MAFNKVILMGRLTSDPELKQSQNGTSVTSFTLAVDRRYGQDKQTDFISCVAWRQTAEFICKYFGKGTAMLVCGELQTRSWTDKEGGKRYATEVVASEVSFCESKKASETNYAPDNQNGSQGNFEPYSTPSFTTPTFEEVSSDGDLPF